MWGCGTSCTAARSRTLGPWTSGNRSASCGAPQPCPPGSAWTAAWAALPCTWKPRTALAQVGLGLSVLNCCDQVGSGLDRFKRWCGEYDCDARAASGDCLARQPCPAPGDAAHYLGTGVAAACAAACAAVKPFVMNTLTAAQQQGPDAVSRAACPVHRGLPWAHESTCARSSICKMLSFQGEWAVRPASQLDQHPSFLRSGSTCAPAVAYMG